MFTDCDLRRNLNTAVRSRRAAVHEPIIKNPAHFACDRENRSRPLVNSLLQARIGETAWNRSESALLFVFLFGSGTGMLLFVLYTRPAYRMQPSTPSARSEPLLPKPLALPLRALPAPVHSRTLVTMLNRLFDDSIRAGELDFLLGRLVGISIEDAGVEYRLTFDGNRLVAGDRMRTPDLALKGTLYNYMLLASRVEDTDTLFFSRRLHMQGDTELGLYLKNFLDGLDMDSYKIPAMFESVIRKSLPLYERLFG